jgi:hypothetical protein
MAWHGLDSYVQEPGAVMPASRDKDIASAAGRYSAVARWHDEDSEQARDARAERDALAVRAAIEAAAARAIARTGRRSDEQIAKLWAIVRTALPRPDGDRDDPKGTHDQ